MRTRMWCCQEASGESSSSLIDAEGVQRAIFSKIYVARTGLGSRPAQIQSSSLC